MRRKVVVLIPLLLDDPLWVDTVYVEKKVEVVLIPLLLDDPLWAMKSTMLESNGIVLIPLLLDDPLWAKLIAYFGNITWSLNPSFAG